MKEICEIIVKANKKTNFLRNKKTKEPWYPTAKEVFEMNPRGELSSVFDWYNIALTILDEDF
jgi:hypothetical protein